MSLDSEGVVKVKEKMEFHLKSTFGHAEFRQPQEDIIKTLLEGKNVFATLPTGYGKSLCYQLPSVVFSGLTVVISPLIALMQDQVSAAQKIGLSCEFINSALSKKERQKRYKKLSQGKFSLLYVTPERFRNTDFCEALLKNEISLLAIDEAHCISQWGHDFRPDYSKVHEIRGVIGNPLTIALTATATPQVKVDILSQIQKSPEEGFEEFHLSPHRKNIFVDIQDVHGVDQKLQAMVAAQSMYSGSGIVYFLLIQSLEEMSRQLRKLGIVHGTYHGQLSPQRRHREMNEFFEDKKMWMLATPAFGLGVDKKDIRTIIHAEMPGSIEAYFQEIGRAGRDGKAAQSLLLFDEDDVSISMDFIKWTLPDPSFFRGLFNLLARNRDRILVEGNDYLRSHMNFYNQRDFRLETALRLMQRWDCIEVNPQRPTDIQVVGDLPEEFLSEEKFKSRTQSLNQKLLQMLRLAQEKEKCLKNIIYEYFGDHPQTDCGNCHSCLRRGFFDDRRVSPNGHL